MLRLEDLADEVQNRRRFPEGSRFRREGTRPAWIRYPSLLFISTRLHPILPREENAVLSVSSPAWPCGGLILGFPRKR